MTESDGSNGRYLTVREFYEKLDARFDNLNRDIKPRLRRVEIGVACLLVMSGSQLASLIGAPSPPQVAFEALTHLFA